MIFTFKERKPAPSDFGGTVDPTGRALNKPVYPPEEQRRGITGTTSVANLGVQLNVPIYSGGGVQSALRQAVAERTKAFLRT
mgnify:CR=1 FL=1